MARLRGWRLGALDGEPVVLTSSLNEPEPIIIEGHTADEISEAIAQLRNQGFHHDELRMHAGRLRVPLSTGFDEHGEEILVSKVPAGVSFFGVRVI